jgi:hypothetical protein
MALGRQGDTQAELMVGWAEMPRSPGHVFYDRLQEVLTTTGFDGFVEDSARHIRQRVAAALKLAPRASRPSPVLAGNEVRRFVCYQFWLIR